MQSEILPTPQFVLKVRKTTLEELEDIGLDRVKGKLGGAFPDDPMRVDEIIAAIEAGIGRADMPQQLAISASHDYLTASEVNLFHECHNLILLLI